MLSIYNDLLSRVAGFTPDHNVLAVCTGHIIPIGREMFAFALAADPELFY